MPSPVLSWAALLCRISSPSPCDNASHSIPDPAPHLIFNWYLALTSIHSTLWLRFTTRPAGLHFISIPATSARLEKWISWRKNQPDNFRGAEITEKVKDRWEDEKLKLVLMLSAATSLFVTHGLLQCSVLDHPFHHVLPHNLLSFYLLGYITSSSSPLHPHSYPLWPLTVPLLLISHPSPSCITTNTVYCNRRWIAGC